MNNNSIAKPLSDDDVSKLMKKISLCTKEEITELSNIFVEFSNTLNSIISIALDQAKDSGDEEDITELERARRIIGMCPLEEKLIRVKDKVWNVHEHIINKNAKFFLDRDYSGMIKKDQNKAFIEALMEIVKNNFEDLPKEHQDHYWKKAKKLVKLVAKFKKIIKDF